MLSSYFLLLSLSLAANAQFSLFLPGFDPQPISAINIGVGEGDRTTWRIQAGTATSPDETPFPGTATLVQGPTDIAFNFKGDSFSLAQNCNYNAANVATCTAVFDGVTEIGVDTLTAIAVQTGAEAGGSQSASASASPTGAPSVSPGGSSPSPSTRPTQITGASAVQPSQSGGAAGCMGASAILVGLVGAGIALRQVAC